MNNKSKPTRRPRVPKETQSNITGIVVKIGKRDFDYDKVRTATLHAPLIDTPLEQISIFRDVMQSDIVNMDTNPVDDGIIRIVRVRPEFYEVISGKNKIIAAIFDYKKAYRALGEKPENAGKKVSELLKMPVLKARLASWKHLNPCEHFGRKLDGDELKASLQQVSETTGIAVKIKSDSRPIGDNVAALFQPPKKEPKAAAPSSGKFGRIFGGAQTATA
jgi:hypothetical protein